MIGETELDNANQNRMASIKSVLKEYGILTFATFLMATGIYFFRFPNNFSFGGVTGIAVILAKFLPISASTVTFILNVALLIVGLVVLGGSFGIKTVYVTLLLSGSFSLLELLVPMTEPLTTQPLLELIFAVVVPAFASALMFNSNASSGGTDIIAMILTKYTKINISITLMIADMAVAISSFFIFNAETGLFSVCGLLAKSLVIDTVIENINLSKVFTIISSEPEPICEFIIRTLKRGVTTYDAMGYYKHEKKTVIVTIMNRNQAIMLRNFIKSHEPHAFIAITNSSEIIGKGFHSPM